MTAFVSAVVEGDVDAAVMRRLAGEAGLFVSSVHVKGGKQNVRARISGYNEAARQSPFIVLVDLDVAHDCAPELVREWLPERDPGLCFRVAVRTVESWLLGDRERAATGRRRGVLRQFGASEKSPESVLCPAHIAR